MDEKKKAHWTLDATTLTVTLPKGTKAGFDLAKIWPDFEKHTGVQQYLEAYGVKQNLADKTAVGKEVEKTEASTTQVMTDRFDALVRGEVKQTGASRISFKKQLTEGMEKNLDEKEQKQLAKLLAKAGMKL